MNALDVGYSVGTGGQCVGLILCSANWSQAHPYLSTAASVLAYIHPPHCILIGSLTQADTLESGGQEGASPCLST